MSCRVCFAVAIAVTLGSRHATADSGIQLAGTLYKLGSNRQERLYTWEVEACAKVWTSRYRRLDGTLAVEDRTEFAGDRLTGYRYVRHTIGERSSVTVEGQRLRFELERGADRRTETKLTSDVFLAGPAVFRFIQAHLGELAAGRELDFKYGVLDRLDYSPSGCGSRTGGATTTSASRSAPRVPSSGWPSIPST
jgi:hypothetical protein